MSVVQNFVAVFSRMQMVNRIADLKQGTGWKRQRLRVAPLQNLNFGK
jgi:hypothetical protein